MKIIAMSSGLLQQTPAAVLMRDYLFGMVPASRPRVALIPTATGDAAATIVDFYAAFGTHRCEPSHLGLFGRPMEDIRSYVLRQQLIYVSGGNTANLLAIWRTHGLDAILHEAWEEGVILCGNSAGGLCWFESGTTDSFGATLAPLKSGLGWLPGSFSPHYDAEEQRRPIYHRCVREGMPAGWAIDDGVALHFEGRELREIVSAVPTAQAYRVELTENGVRETQVSPRVLS